MKVRPLEIEGPLLVEGEIFRDSRGFFMERFQEERFREYGIDVAFVQDNHSRSNPHVIRGLHYQIEPPMGKLVGVVRGKIWDVIVDVRPESKNYGKYAAVELSDESNTLVWIPSGFAHGFCVISKEPADVLYKVTQKYDPKAERGIRWNDPEIAIRWPDSDPILSPRDIALPTLSFEKN